MNTSRNNLWKYPMDFNYLPPNIGDYKLLWSPKRFGML